MEWMTVAALVVLVLLLLMFVPVLLGEVADIISSVITLIIFPLIIVCVAYLLYVMVYT